MKRILTLLLTAVMVLPLAACGGGDAGAGGSGSGADGAVDPVAIRIYNPVAGATTDGMIEKFSKLVSEYSEGAITCDITPAGTLGAERETGQMLMLGDVDLTLLSIDGVDMALAKEGMSWICLPGLFNDYDEVDSEFVNGWMFERQREMAAENGMDLIAPIENGLKVIVGTGTPIQSLSDFKGKILRVPDIEFHHSYYTALGAMPVSGIDMYTGMQQHTMDGIPNNPWALELFKIDEVADWVLKLNDIYGTMYWSANGDFSSSLTDEQRDIIYRACKETAEETRAEMRQIGADWLAKCEENPNIQVIEPSAELKAQIQEIGYGIWEDYADDFDSVAMERLLSEYAPK